ncbi:hypothetical protein IFM89_033310 [Coptis chinensis]|uniref:Helicase ATP-binding domain-containing protein n=1 Tax=Coptis chinensis TaxID=261450 RepID=A0A835HGW1_9MAGN|nr:hypothetical protein IFM89_033310 [Coptis chinensis]
MPPKRATTSKTLMVEEASTSQAASKNADRRARRSVSRMVEEVDEIREEEVSLKDLLRRIAELEKQNQMLMAENKAVREEKEKRDEDSMYEKDDEESRLAETGSGKTAAFALPILQKLAKNHYGVYVLVITPMRELAFQLADQFKALGSSLSLRCSVIVGGMDMIE